MSGELNNRSRKILHALVSEYIATGEPVGSRVLSRKYDLQLSPASIRNVMSDLEEVGYLKAPHTSAGRVPTGKGLRFFIDTLVKVRDISDADRERIHEAIGPHAQAGLEVSSVMRETSRLLSQLSQHAGIVLAPKPDTSTFKHVEFVKLSADQLLAILVTTSGLVQNRLVRTPEVGVPLVQSELDRMGNYLNDILSGLTLPEVRERVLFERGLAKNAYDVMLGRALALGAAVVGEPSERSDVFIEGQSNLLDQPEFDDLEKLRTLLRAFEEKNQIVSLLDSTLEAKGIQIFIGAETPYLQLQDCAIVTASYGSSDRTLGTLGVIGPTRMNYSRVVSLVDCTARVISDVLEPLCG